MASSAACAMDESAMAGAALPEAAPRRRRFLTQREFRELKESRSSGADLPSSSIAATSSDAAPKTPVRKLSPENLEGGGESEVETHVSDGSELPSSASAVAAMLEASSSTDRSIMCEIQRLRQENSALRLENAVLRSETAEDSPKLSTAAALACGTPASKLLRFGAPLRYMVAPRIGDPAASFELSLDDSDAIRLRRSITSST